MAIWYLDDDDEITDAVARLRAATDEHVVFVVPPGSRIATGRINFKLLAREASARDLALAIASQDEQVRALATSAGVLARPSVDEAQASLARGDEVAPAPRTEPETSTSTGTTASPSDAGRDARAGPARTIPRPTGRRLAATVIAVLAVVVVGGVAALQVLPTAEITLRPHSQPIGPISLEVMALTTMAAPDLEAAAVPATTVSIPLAVEGTFTTTGAASVASRAAGEVVFSSSEQAFDQEIVAGTRVRTPDGIEFQTTDAVVLERPEGGGGTRVTATVEAIEAGPEGNVPAGAISVVPSLESQGISVRNPRPTSGGRLEQTPILTQGDYDAAAVDLRNRLTGALAARLREPDVAPEGLTPYPETAELGAIELDPPADEVVGTSAAEFELRAVASAEVLAVDPEDVRDVLAAALDEAVPAGMALVPASASITPGLGTVGEDAIAFEGTASGVAYVVVEPAEVASRIAGLPISDARAILDGLGTASVEVWPDFLGDLPGDPARISLDVLEPSTTEQATGS